MSTDVHYRDRLRRVEDRNATLHASASLVQEQLESLDEDCQHTELDPETGKTTTLSETFRHRVKSALAPSPWRNCSCQVCLSKKTRGLLKRALEFGEAAKQKLEDAVDQKWNGPGSLNYEREQTRRE